MNRHITVGLAMLAGAALGAAAVGGLHAQAKPPAIAVAEITVTNEDGYNREYLPPIIQALRDAGGKFLARSGRTLSVEGPAPARRVVVVQFESLDKAQAFRDSAAYKNAQAIGQKYATFRVFAVEGLAP